LSCKRLYLIDGMSHIYRAYYAPMQRLSTSKGLPTNAIFGFTTMLRKLIEEQKPDYIGVALDVEGPTVRHEMYESYKATRKPMPEDLVRQIPYILRVCEAFRVPMIGFSGYEADDVIGTLSRKAADQGLAAIIVTSDKDMFQLVSDHTLVLDPRKDNLLLDAAKVVEKMGVKPEQIADLLGLMGDTIDNIPGAPGVGEKGAKELIQTFGSIENCLKNWDKVKKKTYRESLRDNAELIRMSYDLATIRRDLPIDLDLDALVLSEPDGKAVFELFAELEFKSLVNEFRGALKVEAPSAEWLSGEAASDFLSSLGAQERLYFALGFRRGIFSRRVAEAVCVQGETGSPALVNLQDQPVRDVWARLMQNPAVAKICWDVKLAQLSQEGRDIHLAPRVEDPMLMAFLTASHIGDYSLRRWALDELRVALSEPVESDQALLPEQPREALGTHLASEQDALRRLFALLSPRLEEMGLRKVYEEIELPLIPVLAEMERVGVKIDRAMLAEMSGKMEQELEQITQRIYAAAGTEFNINSTKQLAEILFEKLNLPSARKTRKTGGYSTDQAVLEELAVSYELPRLILDYRQIAKLKSTYVDALPGLIHPQTGRVHASFNQTGAATGRISSSDPNLQNIPIRTELGRLIRAAFVPDAGNVLISADYSQVELRVLAHLSGDPVLIEAFRRNQDIHTRTAEEVFGEAARQNPSEFRRRAKVINFGIIYGLSAFGLARQLGISREEGQAFIDAYFERYQGVRVWLDKTLEEARKTGRVRTLFGRVRPIPDILTRDYNARNFAERTALNSPIQGTAADIIKLAMIRIYRAFKNRGFSAKITIQVHDELVLEVPEAESEEVQNLVRHEMENAGALDVPLVVDLTAGKNWKDMK